jgi:hypothetical protein
MNPFGIGDLNLDLSDLYLSTLSLFRKGEINQSYAEILVEILEEETPNSSERSFTIEDYKKRAAFVASLFTTEPIWLLSSYPLNNLIGSFSNDHLHCQNTFLVSRCTYLVLRCKQHYKPFLRRVKPAKGELFPRALCLPNATR